MQAGLAATLACLQAAQAVQTLSAAVLLSCTVPIAQDSACGPPAVAGPPAGARPAAAAASAPLPSASPAAPTGKRPRQQHAQPAPQEQPAGSDAGWAQPAAAEEQPGGSAAKRAKREAKQERRQQRRARRAAKEEARKQRQAQQQLSSQEAETEQQQQQPEQLQQLQQRQPALPPAEQEADGHPGQPAHSPMPGAPAAAGPPPPPSARAAAGSGAAAAGQSSQQQGGPDLYRFWSPLEAARLVRCVDEPEFRRQLLGSEALDWQAIADHFGRSVQAVRSKHRLEHVMKADKESGPRHRGGNARKAISYGYMALFALASLPDRSGTGEEILAAVEAHGPFQPLLDRSCRPDSMGVLKWKQRIREELSHRSYFVNTGEKRGGETIWRLDASNFDSMPPAQRSKLAAQLPGLPLLGKHGLLNG